MKTITKFLTLILSLFCVFGLMSPVYAEGEDHDTITSISAHDANGNELTIQSGYRFDIEKDETYTVHVEGNGKYDVTSIIPTIEKNLSAVEAFKYEIGETHSTNNDGTYTWSYEFTVTSTAAGASCFVDLGDNLYRSFQTSITENDAPYFSRYGVYDDGDGTGKGGTELTSNKTDAYDFTLNLGDTWYGVAFNWNGLLNTTGKERLAKFSDTGYFEVDEEGSATEYNQSSSFWYHGWNYYGIKPTKVGTTTVEIFPGKPITFHIVDPNASEDVQENYVTVTNFEDMTVVSGTELSGTFTTEWKNTDGHQWNEALYGSSDGGKTWERIYSYGSGADSGPKFVSTKDSGYQLKLVCVVDNKEVYNKVITVTVVDKTATSETSEGTPTTSATYDEQTLIDTLKESSYLTDEQKTAAKFGEVSIKTTASKIEPTEEDKKLVEAQLNSTNKIAMYLDLKVVASVSKNDVKVGDDVTVSETGTPVKFTVALDDSLINTKNTVDRTYQVVRVHNGVVDVLPATFDADNKTITFETDKFSTYAVMYTDTPKASKTPSTADGMNVTLYASVAIISTLVVGMLFFFKKRNA